MTVRKDFMLCPTGRGLAATRRPFGDAHLPVWHSIGTRISSHYQTTQYKNEVSTLSGDLTINLGSKCKWNLHLLLEMTIRKKSLRFCDWCLIFRLIMRYNSQSINGKE